MSKVHLLVDRHDRESTWSEAWPSGRWRACEYDERVAHDKASLAIFWPRDEALADSDNVAPPDVSAQETVDDLEAALEQFRLIAADLAQERAVPALDDAGESLLS